MTQPTVDALRDRVTDLLTRYSQVVDYVDSEDIPHWLQFAVDHSIELPEDRIEAHDYMQIHYPEAFI